MPTQNGSFFTKISSKKNWISSSDLKGIPPKLAQYYIELDTLIPLAHQAKYRMNPNYVVANKQYIDNLLITKLYSL
jgi:hypothetical protein